MGGWLVAGCGSFVTAAETLRVRADAWMPFNGAPAAAEPGYTVEVLRQVFTPLGIEVDYQTMPWAEALEGARKGTVDAVVGANRTEAEGLIVPAEPIGQAKMGLFVPGASAWRYDNIASLKSIRLGVVAGYSYWAAIDTYVKTPPPGASITTFDSAEPLGDAMRALLDGKIDAIPETLPVFIWRSRQLGLPMSAFRVAYIHEGADIFVAFSPAQPESKRYAELLSQGIDRLRQSGQLGQILKKYGLSDWK